MVVCLNHFCLLPHNTLLVLHAAPGKGLQVFIINQTEISFVAQGFDGETGEGTGHDGNTANFVGRDRCIGEKKGECEQS